MKTIITLLLDRSGSMGGLENDVVGGVNTFIAKQQENPQDDTITFNRFDSGGLETFRERAKVADAQPISRADYQPRGGTPLLDCIGKTFAQMEEDWKAEKPDRAILVIFTDGHENESKEFTKDKIKAMIKSREDSGLWAVIYMGAHADAFDEAAKYGISTANTASYGNTARGTATAYAAVSDTVSMMKSSGVMQASNLGKALDDEPSGLTPGGSCRAQAPSVHINIPVAPAVTIPPVVLANPKPVPPPATWTPPAPSGPWTPPA